MAAHATDTSGSSGTQPLAPDACPLLDLASAPAGGASAVDSSNRCVSFSHPRVIAVTQQRLVCLDGAHVDCPLFARAGRRGRGYGGRSALAMSVPVAVPVAVVGRPAAVAVRPAGLDAAGLATTTDHVDDVRSFESGTVAFPLAPIRRAPHWRQARPSSGPMPTIIAAIILVVALGAAFTFTTLRGGLSLPGEGSGSSGIAAGSGAPSTSTAPGALTPNPTVQPASGSPIPPGTATAAASPRTPPPPSAAPAPTPGPTTRPIATPTPGPVQTPSATLPPAFAGLAACPNRTGCYLYRIRSGDNLTAVAQRFGVTLAALRAANPEIVDPSLIHVGDLIRIPVPIPAP